VSRSRLAGTVLSPRSPGRWHLSPRSPGRWQRHSLPALPGGCHAEKLI
jgi:hypothetical protein